MLPREHRVRTSVEWDALFRDGYGVGGPVLSLRLKPTPGSRRVGFSVGRKVGGAVVRNLVKRRLRDLMRRLWDELPEADIAVLAKPASGTASFEALESALRVLLSSLPTPSRRSGRH